LGVKFETGARLNSEGVYLCSSVPVCWAAFKLWEMRLRKKEMRLRMVNKQ